MFSETARGMKLKLCRNFHNISLYKIVFLLPLGMGFRRYGKLKFPYTFNGKSESRPLFMSHCGYFEKKKKEEKRLQKCLLSSLLQNIWILSKPLNLIRYHGNQKAKFAIFFF